MTMITPQLIVEPDDGLEPVVAFVPGSRRTPLIKKSALGEGQLRATGAGQGRRRAPTEMSRG